MVYMSPIPLVTSCTRYSASFSLSSSVLTEKPDTGPENNWNNLDLLLEATGSSFLKI